MKAEKFEFGTKIDIKLKDRKKEKSFMFIISEVQNEKIWLDYYIIGNGFIF